MADIKVRKSSKLVVTVSPSDDCVITVRRGFAPSTTVKSGAELPTDDVGLYVVVAADNRNRPLTMTLTGQPGFAVPPAVTNPTPSARVRMTYEVALAIP